LHTRTAGWRWLLCGVLLIGACTAKDAPTTTAPTAPDAPTGVSATAGDRSATISFTAPANNGGSPILSFQARCASGSTSVLLGIDTKSPITLTGLTNGVAYTCTVVAVNAIGTGPASTGVTVTPVLITGSAFTLASRAILANASGPGSLNIQYSCDGPGASPDLLWANAPAGTKEFAVLMTTLPGDGATKYNWVLYGIPGTTSALGIDNFGIGIAGVGSDGPSAGYQPPCSQGPGAKTYTFTIYALSAAPTLTVPASQVTGPLLAAAIAPITLSSASFDAIYTRRTYATATQCATLRASIISTATTPVTVSCDSVYGMISTTGMASHAMMSGITATNLQVPVPQAFLGFSAWRIPLLPTIAAATTAVDDGPIGVAVNGVPLFNPCKQGGCQNGDTKVLGELDNCNGHAGRADDYHYHAAPTCLMATRPAAYWDTHPLGWALDGYAIFGYNDANGTVASRDNICGGNTSAVQNAPSGYSYHVTDAPPYVLSCLRGVPSGDLAGQSAKYKPMRQPPVTPFPVTNMTLTNDPTDGYDVLQFTSSRTFVTTETGTDSYSNTAGTYRIRYKQVSGAALATLLAQTANTGKTACWNFQFTSGAGAATQPSVNYCR
jgi:phosphatidylethanolamine-binding protein (PEBP) family uncharacterized protein